MKRLFPFLVLIACACSSVDPVSSCTSEVTSDKWEKLDQVQLEKDINTIDAYLSANSINAIKHPSGIRYAISQLGSGDNVPCIQSLISITYEGRILGNGALFDKSSKPTALSLSQLILGWQIAFLEINKGTKMTLYIPSGLAYGNSSNSSIPQNSNLVFEIELLDFR